MAWTHKAGKYEDVNVYNNNYSIEEMQKIRRTLAKRANQRIVRLERASSIVTGESYASYGANEKAQTYLKGTGVKSGRFKETLKSVSNAWVLKREIGILQTFLQSKSSTVTGQKDAERKRIETFRSGKWGGTESGFGNEQKIRKSIESATNKDFYDILGSVQYKLLQDGFTSSQMVEAIDDAMKSGQTREQIYTILEDIINLKKNKTDVDLELEWDRISEVRKFNGALLKNR